MADALPRVEEAAASRSDRRPDAETKENRPIKTPLVHKVVMEESQPLGENGAQAGSSSVKDGQVTRGNSSMPGGESFRT